MADYNVVGFLFDIYLSEARTNAMIFVAALSSHLLSVIPCLAYARQGELI